MGRSVARPLLLPIVLAVCLVATACSGYQPTEFPNERENPTFSGLFTGQDGEWVVYRKEKDQ